MERPEEREHAFSDCESLAAVLLKSSAVLPCYSISNLIGAKGSSTAGRPVHPPPGLVRPGVEQRAPTSHKTVKSCFRECTWCVDGKLVQMCSSWKVQPHLSRLNLAPQGIKRKWWRPATVLMTEFLSNTARVTVFHHASALLQKARHQVLTKLTVVPHWYPPSRRAADKRQRWPRTRNRPCHCAWLMGSTQKQRRI